jgi:hypothetical protein
VLPEKLVLQHLQGDGKLPCRNCSPSFIGQKLLLAAAVVVVEREDHVLRASRCRGGSNAEEPDSPRPKERRRFETMAGKGRDAGGGGICNLHDE